MKLTTLTTLTGQPRLTEKGTALAVAESVADAQQKLDGT